MKKLVLTSLILLFAVSAQAANESDKATKQCLAYTCPGATIFFQFGGFYSSGYGNLVDNYAADGNLPSGLFGADFMTRFGLGYNVNQFLGFELAFVDNGVDFNERHNVPVVSADTQQEYDFDVYNLEAAMVLKNSFADLNSEIHAKFGVAYTYGTQTVSFHSAPTSLIRPSWLNGQRQFDNIYHAWGIAPVFGVGFGWSVSKYLAYSVDYERVFKPFMGETQYNDPLNSSMQATNMWLLGVNYHF